MSLGSGSRRRLFPAECTLWKARSEPTAKTPQSPMIRADEVVHVRIFKESGDHDATVSRIETVLAMAPVNISQIFRESPQVRALAPE